MDYNATLELDVRPDPDLTERLVDQLAAFAAAAAPTDAGRLTLTITITAGSVRQAAQLTLALVDRTLRDLSTPDQSTPDQSTPDQSTPDPDLPSADLSVTDLSNLAAGEDLVVGIEVLPTAAYDARLGMAGLQEVLSVGETATELGISEQAVRQRLDAGTLAGRKAGRAWHIPREAVEAAKTRQQTRTRVRRRPPGSRPGEIQAALRRRGYPDPIPADLAAAIVGTWGLPGPVTIPPLDGGAEMVPLGWVADTLDRHRVTPYAAEHDLPRHAAPDGSA